MHRIGGFARTKSLDRGRRRGSQFCVGRARVRVCRVVVLDALRCTYMLMALVGMWTTEGGWGDDETGDVR